MAKHSTGFRNRRYKCGSENHLAPKCPWRDAPKSELGTATPGPGKARLPSYSAIPIETPVSVKKADQSEREGANGDQGQSFATALSGVSYFLSRSRIAWRLWIRALRPILHVSVGSIPATAFCIREDIGRLRHIRHLCASNLAAVALEKYVALRRQFGRQERIRRFCAGCGYFGVIARGRIGGTVGGS